MKIKLTTCLLAAFSLLVSISTFGQEKDINVVESTINWTGKKVTGAHTGTLKFSSGFLEFSSDNITGGEFVVDMTSLTVTDLEAGKGKEKLEGHLNSDDFFSTSTYKTATLVITKAEKSKSGYTVTGDLTIKGKTNIISFDLTIGSNSATTNVIVDRTKYDIKYGSGSFFENLGNKAISNDFELAIHIKL